jgi:hypothetical protein
MKFMIIPLIIIGTSGILRFEEYFGSHFGKIFNRFITEYRYTRNITRNAESSAVWNLKPERWG